MPSTGNCSAGSDCSRSRVSIAEVAVSAEAIKSSGHVAPLIFLVRVRDRLDRRRLPAVCTENSNPDVMMVKPAEDWV